jgi:hypothetical protein
VVHVPATIPLEYKYKKGSTNHVADCLSRPPLTILTTVLKSYGHETSGWSQLYNNDSDFATSYQTLSARKSVPDFHLQDGLLCHLSHLCVPSSESAKMTWEAHYSWAARHFGVEKIVAVLQNHFYWMKLRQDVLSTSDPALPTLLPIPPSRNRGYTPLFLLRIGLGSPSAMDYMFGLPSTKHGNECVFVVVD